MDPDLALLELKEITSNVLSDPYGEHDSRRFAKLFESLDQWLCAGGFLPHDWKWRGSECT